MPGWPDRENFNDLLVDMENIKGWADIIMDGNMSAAYDALSAVSLLNKQWYNQAKSSTKIYNYLWNFCDECILKHYFVPEYNQLYLGNAILKSVSCSISLPFNSLWRVNHVAVCVLYHCFVPGYNNFISEVIMKSVSCSTFCLVVLFCSEIQSILRLKWL